MKEIMAIIQPDKINRTKEALALAGVPSFFAREASGRGKGLVQAKLVEGAQEGFEEAASVLAGGRLFPKRVITVVVEDEMVDTVVQTIIKNNITGGPGDGKIFVMPMEDAIRVRTAEEGEAAIK